MAHTTLHLTLHIELVLTGGMRDLNLISPKGNPGSIFIGSTAHKHLNWYFLLYVLLFKFNQKRGKKLLL